MSKADLASVRRELGENAPAECEPADPAGPVRAKGRPLRCALKNRVLMSRTALLALAVVVLFAVSILLGSYTVTVPDFVRILTAHLTGGERIPGASFIVMENKLPRAVIGTMIGIAFGLSGLSLIHI